MNRRIPCFGWLLGTVLAAGGAAQGFNALPRVELTDVYHAQAMNPTIVTNDLAVQTTGAPWRFSAGNKCHFTFFSPSARNVAVDDAGLRFTTDGSEVEVGWGNYNNIQAPAERRRMFSGFNEVELVVRQTATGSVWRFSLWMDGVEKIAGNMGGTRAFELGNVSLPTILAESRLEARATGTNRQTLRFRAFRGHPDGFSVRIAGPTNNQVVIEQVRVLQIVKSGVFRHTFQLPAGRAIWRAVAELGPGRLWVNGREVEVLPNLFRIKEAARTFPVDLTPHLTPGAANVIALDATDSLPYFQGRVVLDDGRDIPLDSGPAWKTTLAPPPGWTNAGFDDSAWAAAAAAPLPTTLDRRWPAYDGPLLLENPGADPKLYFDAARPVQVRLRVPPGLAAESASARWVLRRVHPGNERPEVGRGTATVWAAHAATASSVAALDLGVHEPGVYTLEVDVYHGDRPRAHRIEEPLVVVGRLPMKEVPGDTYEQGMDLELEDVIDFTDPADPHAWTEATAPASTGAGPAGERVLKPRIVRKPGLVYREVTDTGKAAMFAYRFEFQHPGEWYLLVLEYPNDAERWMGAAVVGAVRWYLDVPPLPGRGSGYANSAPALVTGGKYPVDHTMKEMRWLCWARPEIQTLELVNVAAGLRAAAARLRIYRVKDLPAMTAAGLDERLFGIHTERALQTANSFGDSSGLDVYQNVYNQLGYDMVAKYTQRHRWYYEACRNFAAYLRFTGQNAHVMGAFQYSEGNTPYALPAHLPGDGHVPCDISETALRVFERNGIAMYSLVEYIEHKAMRQHFAASDEDIAAGADTIQFVSREGKKGGITANPNHPAVETGYLRVADELAEKFAFSPAWKGIFYNVAPGEFGPSSPSSGETPLDFDYSDATIARFERETGSALPVDPKDPDRFAKRYLLLTSDALRETWIDWRCRAMGSYLTLTRDRLRRRRPDLNVLCGWHICDRPIRFWLKDPDGVPYRDFARRMGMDPSAVRDEPGIWFGRTIYPIGSSHGQGGGPLVWAHAVDPAVTAYYAMPNRLVVLNTCWYEYRTRPNDPSWPTGVKPNTLGLVAQAHDDCALEAYTQAIIGADPDILLYGFIDCPMIVSREQQVREVARLITALPRDRFEPVLGTADFRHNLALRALRKDGALWFYAANPGYWPIEGEVTLNGPASVRRPQDGRAVETRESESGTVIPIALKPFGLAGFKVTPRTPGRPDLEIVAWTNQPVAEPHLAHMRAVMSEIAGLLDHPEAALSLTVDERAFLRAAIKRVADCLAAGDTAAAWSELTFWRVWDLRQTLRTARDLSARLPGRPAEPAPSVADSWDRPTLAVAAVQGAPPTLDARLNEAAWKNAPASFRFLSVAGGNDYKGLPLMDTAVQACYDRDRLYLGLRMADRDLRALRATAAPGNPIEILRKYDDAIVMFFNVHSNQIGQFAVNAAGTRYFANSGAWNVDENILRPDAWETAVRAADGYWCIEAAIPFATLQAPAPAPASVWSANFIRRFRSFVLPESYWARVRSSWSDTECFGRLVFQ